MHRLSVLFISTLSPVLFSACVLNTSALGTNINDPEPNTEACQAKFSKPAIYETVTERIQIAPAKFSPTGRQIAPPTYQSQITQRVLRKRSAEWFDIPCADEVNAELIASLQRALAARGYFSGKLTAMMDHDTKAALRRYQAQNGLDTAVLARQTLLDLGLLTMPRDDLDNT